MTGLLILCLAMLAAEVTPGADTAEQPPNIVIVFVDDMGWGDLPSQGATGWSMPSLDRLEREGTRFTDFTVAQPVCSASRAALLTGCYPNRIGIHGALGPWSDVGIHADEITLAELAKQRGYATGIFGKWHLGHHDEFLPTRHGFDEYLGIPYSNDMWPGHPERPKQWPALPLIDGVETIEEISTLERQDPLTARFTERAVSFIQSHHDRPFLLYLAHPQPHVPLACADRWKGSSEQGRYGDVMQEIDWSVGEVLEALDRCGVSDQTMVMFMSDNGPWLSYGDHAGTSGGWREGKGTTFEGGIRVPCVVRWPGHVKAGAVSASPWMAIDVLPTLAQAMGVSLVHDVDGVDASDVLMSKSVGLGDDHVVFYYYRTNELQAVRSGRWKLHLPHGYRSLEGRAGGSNGVPSRYSYNLPQAFALYDLVADPAEQIDVQADYPDVVDRLMRHVEEVRHDLGDALVEHNGSGVRAPGRVVVSPTP